LIMQAIKLRKEFDELYLSDETDKFSKLKAKKSELGRVVRTIYQLIESNSNIKSKESLAA